MRTVFAAAFVGAAIATYLLRRRRRPLVLFDVDGTLAVPAQRAPDEIVRMLQQLRERGYLVGIVGAGDFEKQQGQLGGPNLLTRLDFCFSENGVHAFRGEQLLHCKSIVEQVGEERWREFEGIVDALLAEVRDEAESLLRKACGPKSRLSERATFLERRNCTVNVCVVGRTPGMSKAERAAFEVVDREAGLRERVRSELVRRCGPATPFKLEFSIGGQIGIDCAPVS